MPLTSLIPKKYRNIGRIRHIAAVFLGHGFGHFISEMGLHRFLPFGRRWKAAYVRDHELDTVPVRLRRAFEELGPTFIKLGQVLSGRSDLISAELAEELQKLQDEVPPFPYEDAKKIIEADLGGSIEDIFAGFDKVPVAAASIAQVHHAVLKDGTEVAVKVRRPGIERELEQDVYILTGIAHLLEKHIQDSRIYNPTGVVEEFARTVRQEINFEIELDNAVKFADIFRDSDTIKIPEVFTVYSSRRVMTMERISGIRINELDRLDAAGFDRVELAMNGAHAFFKQIFENGFFHADPHAGNMFVMEDGRVGLLDFGMVGRLSEENMEVIADTFLALVNRDFDGLVQQYINLGFVSEDMDLDRFRKEFKRDLVDLIDPLYGKALGKIRVGDYLNRVTEIAGRHGMRFPKELVLVNKALFTIEGIGRQLDPEMDFLEVAKPYSTSLVRKKLSPSRYLKKARKNLEELSSFTESLPRHLRVIIGKIKRDDIKVNIEVTHLERFIRDFDRSTNRLSFALIISGITIASSVIIHARMGRFVFGYPVLGLTGYVLAGILGLWLVWGIIRSGRL